MNKKQEHAKYMREYCKKKPLYKRWLCLKNRCNNPNCPDYKNYGGRGITYSKEWEHYQNFEKDMLASYRKGLTLERIDVNGNYCKENCSWIPKGEQSKNTRRNRYLTYNGVTKLFSEWADELGIGRPQLHMRLFRLNWPIEKAFIK